MAQVKTKIRRGHVVIPIKANITEKFVEVQHKSQAGVSYTHYKKMTSGTRIVGENRAARRSSNAFERGVATRLRKQNANEIEKAQKKATQDRVKRKQSSAHERALERKKKVV